MATHPINLPGGSLWTEEPGGLFAAHRVAKSWTWLNQLNTHHIFLQVTSKADPQYIIICTYKFSPTYIPISLIFVSYSLAEKSTMNQSKSELFIIVKEIKLFTIKYMSSYQSITYRNPWTVTLIRKWEWGKINRKIISKLVEKFILS